MGKTLDDSLMTDFKNAVHEAEVYINKKALESLGLCWEFSAWVKIGLQKTTTQFCNHLSDWQSVWDQLPSVSKCFVFH